MRKQCETSTSSSQLDAMIRERQKKRNERMNGRTQYVMEMYNKKMQRLESTQVGRRRGRRREEKGGEKRRVKEERGGEGKRRKVKCFRPLDSAGKFFSITLLITYARSLICRIGSFARRKGGTSASKEDCRDGSTRS